MNSLYALYGKEGEVLTSLQYHRLNELLGTHRSNDLQDTLKLIADIYLNKRQGVSLRKIDWMVTNYSKTMTKGVKIHSTCGVRYRGVQEVYLHWRRNYKRVIFDPFRKQILEIKIIKIDLRKLSQKFKGLNP